MQLAEWKPTGLSGPGIPVTPNEAGQKLSSRPRPCSATLTTPQKRTFWRTLSCHTSTSWKLSLPSAGAGSSHMR